MAFSVGVEWLNIVMRKRKTHQKPVHLREEYTRGDSPESRSQSGSQK